MRTRSAQAIAHPNIAFIKYWGNREPDLRIPANSSLSMTLGGLNTRTAVVFDPKLKQDTLELNQVQLTGQALQRVSRHLDMIRDWGDLTERALVVSENNFPADAGIASSASGMAALTLAGCAAAGLGLTDTDLSRLARRASGSAARSIFGGFVEWQGGSDDQSSYAVPFLPSDHWQLVDWIAVVAEQAKPVGSTEGHRLASTSPLQDARVASASERLEDCKRALQRRDFGHLANTIELDSNAMHAVMMTSSPRLLYWTPTTLEIMREVVSWRAQGVEVAYTLDAGPTVHCLCTIEASQEVERRLHAIPGVLRLLRGYPGQSARLIDPT